MEPIYMDSGATTKPYKEVVDFAMEYLTDKWHNPSALYSKAANVKSDVENSRKIVADFIHANPEEIIFNSGSTEGNNHVIRGFDDMTSGKKSTIYITPIEHKSILNAAANPCIHSQVEYISVDEYGLVDLDALEKQLKGKKSAFLVSVMAANNEVGSVNKLQRIAEIVHKHNGIFHMDATQLLPHYNVNVNELGADLLTGSAHKLGGIKGTGFLYVRSGINLPPLLFGEQESGSRGGTENVMGIMALAKAIELTKADMTNRTMLMTIKRNNLIKGLERLGCKLNGVYMHRLPNNVNVTLPPGVSGESIVYLLDLDGIYISTGSACNSKNVEPSHVLKAIGLTDDEANRSVRFTITEETTDEQIDYVLDCVEKSIKLLTME
jgi:cysteine desulfurase